MSIQSASNEANDSNSRRLSPINDAKRLFNNDNESGENRTRVVATRRFVPQTTDLPTNVSTTKSLSDIPSTTTVQANTVSTTEASTTTPVKVRPVLPRDDSKLFKIYRSFKSLSTFTFLPIPVIPLDDDTEKRKNVSLQPLSELEIKSDFALQKSLQRTTLRTETYTERPNFGKVS